MKIAKYTSEWRYTHYWAESPDERTPLDEANMKNALLKLAEIKRVEPV